jgi:hypothetical protein
MAVVTHFYQFILSEDAMEDQEEKINVTPEFEIPFTRTLSYPIKVGKDGDEITEITVKRRLKAKDLKNLPASSNIKMYHMIQMIALITGTASAIIEELDAEDLLALTEVVSSFLPGGQMTGEL